MRNDGKGTNWKHLLATTLACVALAAALIGTQASAAPPAKAQDRIGIPGPVKFGSESFALAWTSHPSPQLYKQEYLPAGQNVERYTSMLMIDVTTNRTPQQMASEMVASLDARKASDPVTNYSMIRNPSTGELILDFVLHAEEPGTDGIVEWNAYRYTAEGKGTRLVAISRRAYGKGVDPFLRTQLKPMRTRDVATLSSLTVPAIKLAKP